MAVWKFSAQVYSTVDLVDVRNSFADVIGDMDIDAATPTELRFEGGGDSFSFLGTGLTYETFFGIVIGVNSGTITAPQTGIQVSGMLTALTNSGFIGGNNAVNVAGTLSALANLAGGTIRGDNAIYISGSLGGLTQVRFRGAEANHTLVLFEGIDLLTLDDALAQLSEPTPQPVSEAIDRLTQGLRLLTLPDGRLAAFQGGEAKIPGGCRGWGSGHQRQGQKGATGWLNHSVPQARDRPDCDSRALPRSPVCRARRTRRA